MTDTKGTTGAEIKGENERREIAIERIATGKRYGEIDAKAIGSAMAHDLRYRETLATLAKASVASAPASEACTLYGADLGPVLSRASEASMRDAATPASFATGLVRDAISEGRKRARKGSAAVRKALRANGIAAFLPKPVDALPENVSEGEIVGE